MQAKSSMVSRSFLFITLLSISGMPAYASLNVINYSNAYEQLLCPEIFITNLEEQNTLQGSLRSTSPLTIANYASIVCSQQNTNDSGGVINVESLTLQKNTGEVKFTFNRALIEGGVIRTTGNCTIIDNSANQYFVSNQAIQATTAQQNYGGVISSGNNLSIANNRGVICFAYNSAKNKGGAISATQNVSITGNSAPLLLINNLSLHAEASAVAQGGAIYCSNCEFSGNSAPIYLVSNISPAGGACYVGETFTITENSDVIVFANNSSLAELTPTTKTSSAGGAIFCTTLNIENNPAPVCFNNNVAHLYGGAIKCTNLSVKNSGPIQFTHNQSIDGGAIFIDANGACTISADHSDIVFENNYAKTNNADLLYRNSLLCSEQITLKLGAKKNRCLQFYDPIEVVKEATSIVFNPESDQIGTVLFSSNSVPEALTEERNFFSYIRNPLTIQNGVIAVEDRAGIAAYQMTQTSGSILRLGNKAVIATATKHDTTTGNTTTPGASTGSQLTINQLALNLPSIIQKGAEAPKIWIYPKATTTGSPATVTYAEDTDPDITISGPLLLLDSDNNDPFDSLDLSGGITKVPFLYLCDNENKKITITSLNIEAINDAVHYGYQGIWSPYWEEYTTAGGSTLDTANKSHRILYADWTPTGYIANPKFKTPLVANALWQTFYTTMLGLQTLPSINLENSESAFEFKGEGLGITVHQRTKNQVHGFRMESIGYAVGTSSGTRKNQKLAFAFSQNFSHLKEKLSDNKLASKNYFGGMQVHFPLFNEMILTSGSLAYSYGDHKVKNFYKEDEKASEGSFYSYSFAATLNCTLPMFSIGNELTLAPFVEAIAFRAKISSFEETGDFIRKFSSLRPLRTLTTPVGLAMQWSQDSNVPSIWKLKLAYQPMVHKQYPKILTTLMASNGMWTSYGSPLTRHAFATTLSNETWLFHNLKLFLNYHGEISSSTFSNYLKAGSSLHF
ncbi:polymorphic outer membrane protein middle domain-containing protein [Chlamydia vaughanii]|uniref:polymorphic outer membrane protein middle domain-containing protein n=1 Tax=Chlamydia vaughanii TaxID=3112552 RepID=UPI0032B2A5BC